MNSSITLTEKAALRVQDFISRLNGAGLGIRLGVKRTGCSGYSYIFDVVDDASEHDAVFISNNVNIFVDSISLPFVIGSQIDYQMQGLKSGFVVSNPKAKNECGCGESFIV